MNRSKDGLREAVDRATAGRAFVTLSEYGSILGISHAAVSKRHQRGTLGVRTVRLSATAPLLVPTADVYAALGLEQPSVEEQAPRVVLAPVEVHPDGTIRVLDVA